MISLVLIGGRLQYSEQVEKKKGGEGVKRKADEIL